MTLSGEAAYLRQYHQICGVDVYCGEVPCHWPAPVSVPVATARPVVAPRSPPPAPRPAPPPPTPVPAMPLVVPGTLTLAAKQGLLTTLDGEVKNCRACLLARTRTQTVFGVGHPMTPVVFVGEAPGADEDQQGEPFVGPAGKLLTRMVEAAGLRRQEIYIANVLKCRPPGNRNPDNEEIRLCQSFLFRQLEIIAPRVIFTLGRFAILCLLGTGESVSRLRGKRFTWRGIPVIASYHPAYYLRTPSRKKAAWEDLLLLQDLLAEG